MKIETSKWKWFNLNDLFDIKTTKNVKASNVEPGKELNYITRSNYNDGCVIKTSTNYPNSFINKKNTLTIGGENATCFFQTKDYITGNNITKLIPKKFLHINLWRGLFFKMIIDLEKIKYSYNRAFNLKNIKKTKIKLPVKNNQINFNFMEEFIKNLKYSYILNFINKEKQKFKRQPLNLNTKDWKWFSILDLFIFEKHKPFLIKEIEDFPGSTPFISASEFNNGVTFSTSIKTNIIKGNKLTITRNGKVGVVFFQNNDFLASADIQVLKPKDFKLNIFIGIFFKLLLELEKNKYSYGRKISLDRLKQAKIKLPIKNNKIDFNFMERFIKNINYSWILK